jgi:hypothetical protein
MNAGNCACGNVARYINELGDLCCGTCPVRNRMDSIRLADVAPLLAATRNLVEYLRFAHRDGDPDIDPYCVDHYVTRIREIVGVRPSSTPTHATGSDAITTTEITP